MLLKLTNPTPPLPSGLRTITGNMKTGQVVKGILYSNSAYTVQIAEGTFLIVSYNGRNYAVCLETFQVYTGGQDAYLLIQDEHPKVSLTSVPG